MLPGLGGLGPASMLLLVEQRPVLDPRCSTLRGKQEREWKRNR